MRAVDLHSDVQMDLARPGGDPARVLSERHLPGMAAGEVVVRVLSTVSGPPDPTARALRHLAATLAAGCRIATSRAGLDLEPPVFVLGLEGAEPYVDDVGLVEAFHWLGVRVVQPAWMYGNRVTGTCGDVNPEGITPFGRQVLSILGELGAVIDLAHISDAGFRDVVEQYPGPIMCSHTCCRALNDHPRNITDEQARWVAERDGIVGICFVNDFLGGSEPPTIGRCVVHVEHLLEVAGPEHVGIGPDWVNYAIDILRPLNALAAKPVDVECGVPEGLEGPEGLPLLAAELQRRGLPAEEVMGGNALRFLHRALPL